TKDPLRQRVVRVGLETRCQNAILLPGDERRQDASFIARHLELAVGDDAEVDDPRRDRLFTEHHNLVERASDAAFYRQDVTGLDVGVFPVGVDFVAAESGTGPFVLVVEVNRRSRLKQVRPHSESRVVVAAQLPFAGRREKTVVEDEVGVLRLPTELNRLDLDVRERKRSGDIQRISLEARLDEGDW